jgi:hypothetical protein
MRYLLPIVLLLATAVPAFAHQGGQALIYVPLDHIKPGTTFPLIGADLDPSSKVTFTIGLDGKVTHLGSLRSHPDGHFTTSLRLPAGFPKGYAELKAVSAGGAAASTFVLVGDRAAPPKSGGVDKTVAAAIFIGIASLAALTGAFFLVRGR